jgi:hypothetical protein
MRTALEEFKKFLESACDHGFTDRVAAEIWKLGDKLLKSKVISVPDVVWSQSKDTNAANQPEALNEVNTLKQHEDFVIHPDKNDTYRQQDAISKLSRLISLFSTSIPDSWETVNKRQALEARAMLRVGFVFSAYKVNFWYWEMIEMFRK